MSTQVERAHGLEALGIVRSGRVHWNLSPALLYEEAIRRNEGQLAAAGPLNARTGQHTGRSPQDKFTVREPSTEKNIHWGAINRPIEDAHFETLHRDMMGYVQDKELYVLDAWGGADPAYRLPVRIVTEFAWHNLFARNMFIPENDPGKRAEHRPEYTVIDCPGFKANPARHGSRTETAIYVHFGRKLVLIAGSEYAGEIKKSIFTILNYTLPLKGVLSMHCSANVGKNGDSALFFGLSGTGKTTLSSDPQRGLIGDDEHGWSDRGIFNFEGAATRR
jgi:phosphoenolpyruvate carboxykinase (ATP)